MSQMVIRTETPADYAAIARVNALAFGRVGEVLLVDALRHRAGFDPELSLVAEQDGEIIGHGLFVPMIMRLAGGAVQVVALSPLAVHPAWQRRGVGKRILEEGHGRAADKGNVLAFLLGHDTYYPRVGYHTHMFGTAATLVARADLPGVMMDVTEREVRPADVPALRAMWETWFHDVDLALVPEDSVVEWISPARGVHSVVLEDQGAPVAYIRYEEGQAHSPRLWLARDRAAVATALAYLAQRAPADAEVISLRLHPHSRAATEVLGLPYTESFNCWSAAMIRPLDAAHGALAGYMAGVEAGSRAPGLVIWPVEYDIC
jgi:predicted N-acetyltransferase YhbS